MGQNKTTLGIDQNIEALLCYVLGWLTGIVFLFLEKENMFVRFHAMQSLTVFLALFVLHLIVSSIPIIIGLLSPIIFLLILILWILLMVKAFQGKKYKLPWVGEFAENKVFGKNG